jgi:hypothetical protein
MTEIRALVITRKATDLAIDHITNTLHFDTDSPFTWALPGVEALNETQLAVDLRNIFRARDHQASEMGVEVKMYDMQDAKPRAVRGHANWAASTGAFQGSPGPREVAMCLSFRGEANTKRTRGRIYIGPFKQLSCNQRPDLTLRQTVLALANGIANLGGVDIDWCVRSETADQMVPVKHAWVDDEWDTIRSRGLKATTRITSTHDE